MVTLVIAGGRDFNNYILLKTTLDKFIEEHGKVKFICASEFGANTLAEAYAVNGGYPVSSFGDSGNYGEEMIKYAAERNGILIAFWNGKSPGTKGMIDLAKQYGVKTEIVMY
jgi:hypothetical protein